MDIAPYILAHGNWISMAEFMELALYDEAGGYYSRNISNIGFRGDFSTSATMCDLLARRIVQQWRESCKAHSRRLPLIELGGGNGDLAMAICRNMSLWERMLTRYIMVDRSRALRNLQGMVGGHSVTVLSSVEKALKKTNGRAFIFSNELPDAFPARQFVYRGGEWLELGLSVENGRVVRRTQQRPLPTSSAFSRWAQEGQIIEVHESYFAWYAEWQKFWKSGTMLTIDYGQLNDTVYYRRPQGSLRGYKAHTLLEADELPAMAGHCDITCDVNFTDLISLAQGSKGDVVQYMSQRDFLLPLADTTIPEEAHLVAVPGAGNYFNVLLQNRFDV